MSKKSRPFLYPALGTAVIALLVLGVMASNNWLPHTDALSGKRTGWFGRDLQANNSSSSGSGSNAQGSSGSAGLLPFEPPAAVTTTSTPSTLR